jgi:D-amino-acid dehydrogenase
MHYNTNVQTIDTAGSKATGVTTNHGYFAADVVVIALGSESPQITRPLGIKLPIYPVKGYSVTIPIEGRNQAPSMGIADEERKIVIARLGNKLRAAGTAELVGYDHRIDERRARSVLKPMLELFPNGGDAEQVEFWTGLRPMTPDGSPVIGQTRIKNIYLNTGHGSVGWTLACGSARLVSDMITGTVSEVDPTEWSLQRYH